MRQDTAMEYDVVVAGGGVAGIAAALASARQGAKTVLLEKEYCLGGLATLGLIVIYLPLCDGAGVQMSSGIAEELLRMSVGYSHVQLPKAWADPNSTIEERKQQRFRLQYNPASFMLLAEKLLLQSGVKILYDARLIDAHSENGNVTNVAVATKTGTCTIAAKAFVDCTGDSDLCYFADETTYDNPFNVRTGWYFSMEQDAPKLHIVSDNLQFDHPTPETKLYRGTTLEDISRHMLEMHSMILEHQDKIHESGNTESYPLIIPSFHGLRMTRRLSGVFQLCSPKHDHVWFDDAVGMIGNWRKNGEHYAIPFRCIHAAKNQNLYAAGRCSAGDTEGWDMLRVIPSCAVTGEAAGTAAAMQAKLGAVPEIHALQENLVRHGVLLKRELFD